MENYKNAPQHLYGLNPSQINMLSSEDNPLRRQSEAVTEVDTKLANIIHVISFIVSFPMLLTSIINNTNRSQYLQ